MQQDELSCRESLRLLAVAHLALHLLDPFLANPFEGHNACECHANLLVACANPTGDAAALSVQRAQDLAKALESPESVARLRKAENPPFTAGSLRLRGRDSNPNFLVQSQASYR